MALDMSPTSVAVTILNIIEFVSGRVQLVYIAVNLQPTTVAGVKTKLVYCSQPDSFRWKSKGCGYARLQLTHVAMDTKSTLCDFVISSCKERWALLFEKSCHIYWTVVTVVHIGYHMNKRWTFKSINIKSRQLAYVSSCLPLKMYPKIYRIQDFQDSGSQDVWTLSTTIFTLTNSWCGRTSQ